MTRNIFYTIASMLPFGLFGAEAPQKESAPFVLPRLKPGKESSIPLDKFKIEDLSTGDATDVIKKKGRDTSFLELTTHSIWSIPMRGTEKDGECVSILILGSANTVIEIGGARIGMTASAADDSLQLMYDDAASGKNEWRQLGVYVPEQSFEGRAFGAPSVLTVQFNRSQGTWHLFYGPRLLADNLALLAANQPTIKVTSGDQGARVCGIIQIDDNPFYVDRNVNGVDDSFEISTRGKVQLTNLAIEERRILTKQWKAAQAAKPSGLPVNRPLPDKARSGS